MFLRVVCVQAHAVVGARVHGNDGFRYRNAGRRIPSYHRGYNVGIRPFFVLYRLLASFAAYEKLIRADANPEVESRFRGGFSPAPES